MSKNTFQKRFHPLVAILGMVICIWYLVTTPSTGFQLFPALTLAAAITVLTVFAKPSNHLNHTVVLGGVMIYGPITLASAGLVGILLALILKRLIKMEQSFYRCCVELGLLMIPMAITWETLNWQPEILIGYYFGREWYSSVVTFGLIFTGTHATLSLADMLWKEPQLQEINPSQIIGWAWSELAAWPLIFVFSWQYLVNRTRALILLVVLPVAVTLLWYLLFRPKSEEAEPENIPPTQEPN
jgi:hypothetical protein